MVVISLLRGLDLGHENIHLLQNVDRIGEIYNSRELWISLANPNMLM
jgi:hypothetical protein